MEALKAIITVILVICAVLMITVVLLQKSRSAGMGAAFGSETTSFTSKGKAASREAKLQKMTVYLGVAIGVLAIILSIIS